MIGFGVSILLAACGSSSGSGEDVSVCGEIAGDPETAKVLVGLGYRHLSVNAYSIETVGNSLSRGTTDTYRNRADKILNAHTLKEVKRIIAGR